MFRISCFIHQVNVFSRSPYFVAWEYILVSGTGYSSSIRNNRFSSSIYSDPSHLILYDFPDLPSAYLGISDRSFGDVFVQTPRSSIDLVDASGKTTLSWAAGKGDHDTVKELLSFGADPNLADKAGWTSLHMSVMSGKHECVRLMLSAKADVDAKTRTGNKVINLLLSSVINDDPDMIELLVSHGADIESIGVKGWTPLHHAVLYDRPACLSLLLGKGANIKALDLDRNTALQLGIIHNSHQTINVLLDHGGIDYNNKNVSGRTMLHHTAIHGDLDTIAILHSANLRTIELAATENGGYTALDIAIWRYENNERWSNWALKAMEEDLLQRYSAFKDLWNHIAESQGIFDDEVGSGDEELGDDGSEDDESEDRKSDEEEREDWQDASEFADTPSV